MYRYMDDREVQLDFEAVFPEGLYLDSTDPDTTRKQIRADIQREIAEALYLEKIKDEGFRKKMTKILGKKQKEFLKQGKTEAEIAFLLRETVLVHMRHLCNKEAHKIVKKIQREDEYTQGKIAGELIRHFRGRMEKIGPENVRLEGAIRGAIESHTEGDGGNGFRILSEQIIQEYEQAVATADRDLPELMEGLEEEAEKVFREHELMDGTLENDIQRIEAGRRVAGELNREIRETLLKGVESPEGELGLNRPIKR